MAALLNYTTEIKTETTISEIEKMLADSGASMIVKSYDGNSNVESISFQILTERGQVTFKLPLNHKAVMQVINNQTKETRTQKSRSGGRGSKVPVVPKKFYNDENHARRVGWRIIKDWLEAQLALYFLQMVKIEQILLPYMYNRHTGKTMFEELENNNFQLRLENKNEQQ